MRYFDRFCRWTLANRWAPLSFGCVMGVIVALVKTGVIA
jgi:hypothetical protein